MGRGGGEEPRGHCEWEGEGEGLRGHSVSGGEGGGGCSMHNENTNSGRI